MNPLIAIAILVSLFLAYDLFSSAAPANASSSASTAQNPDNPDPDNDDPANIDPYAFEANDPSEPVNGYLEPDDYGIDQV